jgi:hypothetical protein
VKIETLYTYCEQVGRRGNDYETMMMMMIIIIIVIIVIIIITTNTFTLDEAGYDLETANAVM